MTKTKNTKLLFIGAEKCGYMVLKELFRLNVQIDGIITVDEELSHCVTDLRIFDPLLKDFNGPVLKIKKSNKEVYRHMIEQVKPDLILVISWSFIIPNYVLKMTTLGCIGVHNSLLPARRGGAPVAWSIIDGLEQSGITLFYYSNEIDAGDIIAQKKFIISLEDDAKSVLDKVYLNTVDIVRENIFKILDGKNNRIPQDKSMATYTKRRKPEDGDIDWDQDNLSLYNYIRAIVPPYPGAFTMVGKHRKLVFTKIWFNNGELTFEGHLQEVE